VFENRERHLKSRGQARWF